MNGKSIIQNSAEVQEHMPCLRVLPELIEVPLNIRYNSIIGKHQHNAPLSGQRPADTIVKTKEDEL